MIHIIDAKLYVAHSLGRERNCLIAQIPNCLARSEHGYAVADPDQKWHTVESIFELVGKSEGSLKDLRFLVLPEGALPFARFDDTLAAISRCLRPNSITMFGLEHIPLRAYRQLLERFRSDNAEACDLVQQDVDAGSSLESPANVCCIAVKEASGTLRVFLEAKSHPFFGEEYLDKFYDLYQGRHLYLFQNRLSCYNFMVVICVDYLYRDLYGSNIRRIIEHANQMFFSTRHGLDALFVVQCNPKPEHRAYRDLLCGFYGEYLEDTPGVRETVTVFGNCSSESVLQGVTMESAFGASSVVIGNRHKLRRTEASEFRTDDFDGSPVSRLRFGTETRLYYFSLPLHHEPDPRSSRTPIKIHAILSPSPDGGWLRIPGDEMWAGTGIEVARRPYWNQRPDHTGTPHEVVATGEFSSDNL
jgi:hypothetical protein